MNSPQSGAATVGWFTRNEFLIRRLHSLSGLIPVGAYMCVHLMTNASTLAGDDVFQRNVDAIHSLGPLLPFVEWGFIFLPLIFHAAVGVWIARSGEENLGSYRYTGNVRYTLQRVTAWIALFFIFYHVFHMHGWIHTDWWKTTVAEPLNGGQFDPHAAAQSVGAALRPALMKLIYAIGVLSCVYHLANGIWTMGITWGVWVTREAQQRANYVCLAFGLLMAAVGLGALVGASRAGNSSAAAAQSTVPGEATSVDAVPRTAAAK